MVIRRRNRGELEEQRRNRGELEEQRRNRMELEGARRNQTELEGGRRNQMELEGRRRTQMQLEGGRRNQMEPGGGRRNQMQLEGGGSGGPGLPSDRALQPAGNRNFSTVYANICALTLKEYGMFWKKIEQAFTNVDLQVTQLGSAYLAYFLPNFSACLFSQIPLPFHYLFLICSFLHFI